MQDTIFPPGISAIAAPALYADILSVDAPAEANAGDQVTVKVHIKNIYTSRISVKTSAIVFVGTDAVASVDFPTDWLDLDPGISYQFEGYFTMPSSNVRVHAVSYWYGADGNWHIDETMDVNITLADGLLAEFSRVRYWDASIGQYVSEPPTVQIGSTVGADFIVENVSGQSLDIGLFVVAFDPFGNSIAAKLMGPGLLAPGSTFGGWWKITSEFPGTYTFTVDIITSPLIPYGIIGTLGNIPIAYVVGEIPPLSGYLHKPFVVDTTTGEVFYSAELPIEIVGGHRVIVGVSWENDGGETAIFKPSFELVDPDGLLRETQTFTTVLAPTEGTGGQTGRSVELDKPGMWKIHATLEANGTLLDEKTFDAINVTTLPPPEYAGTITEVWINKAPEGTGLPPDTTVVADGNTFEVGTRARNDSSVTFTGTVQVVVYDPDHVKRADKSDSTGIDPGEELYFGEGLGRTFNICSVDKAGGWIIVVTFRGDGILLAHKEYVMTAEAIEYEGTISKKQFKYDSTIDDIPVAEVTQGMNGIVTAWGRNNMAVRQQLGMRWEVRDPLGYVVEQYPGGGNIDWEFGYTGPGDEQDFIGGRFDLDKPGGWTIFIELFMNPPDPVIVDSYMGALCTVEAIEYAGTITEVWINKAPEGTGLPPDTTVVADGNTFEVGTRARNDSSVTFTGTVQVVVYDPDHVKRADKSDSTGIDPGEELYFGEGLGRTFNICSVDKAGGWIIVVTFRGDGILLAHKEYVMTATPAPPEVEFQNFAITGYDGVPVDEQLIVIPGQTVTVHMSVDYRGPAIDGAIWTAMGWYVGVVIKEFVETFNSRTPIHFDASYDFTTYEFDCDVDILTLPPIEEGLYGTLLDMYAKIMEVPGTDIFTPFYIGVMAWSKPPEEYELIQHTISHFAYIYDGDIEVTTVTLKTDPFKPADWVPEKLVAELEREARESGVHILETKVYVDTSPLFWTDYKIEVTGTPSGEVTEGVGVGALPAIPLFVKIIIGALAIAFGILVITWAVKQLLRVFQHKVGLEDVKLAWGKEALILDVQDAEEHWERPLTPKETLEGMSEDELRDTLDQIAEEEIVPLGVSWLPIVIVGGLGVLGAGFVLFLATGRKE